MNQADTRTEQQLHMRDLLVTFGHARGVGFEFDTSLRYAQNVAKLEAANRAAQANQPQKAEV